MPHYFSYPCDDPTRALPFVILYGVGWGGGGGGGGGPHSPFVGRHRRAFEKNGTVGKFGALQPASERCGKGANKKEENGGRFNNK